MSKISHYEKLIQEKRKKTPFRDFVKELGSWEALNLYRRNGRICRYPETDRVKKLGDNFWIDASSCGRDYDFSESFFSNFQSLQDSIPLDYILSFGSNENCDFADCTFQAKNVYLSFVIGLGAEDILYSACSWTNISRVMNSFLVTMNSSEVINSIGVSES